MEEKKINDNIENIESKTAEKESNGPKIVETSSEKKDGQNKCPKCGSTDISMNKKTGKLRCNYCRHEFDPVKAFANENLENLTGFNIGSGAQAIQEGSEDIVTLKCQSCAAEVIINTAESTQSRCHWCRNTLSINQTVPNGAVPDAVLPFSVTKEDAQVEIQKFVKKRSFFGHPKFKKEFTTDNILGVYLPYMIVDINAHATLKGEGEHLVREYTVGSGDDEDTYYDADLYYIEREFDITIDDLTIESSSDKLDRSKKDVTNNIINSVMPFDTENAVHWDANYLKGFSSEKRSVNVVNLQPLIEKQAKDVAKFKANETLKFYDRGVRWDTQELDTKGQQWMAAYLPVWIYSYYQKKGDKGLLHYTAVNARTKETMGSVPINKLKLFFVSLFVEVIALISTMFVDFDGGEFALLLGGPGFFAIMYARYRNSSARHAHETETKSYSKNMRTVDDFVKHRKKLSNAKMTGANNEKV